MPQAPAHRRRHLWLVPALALVLLVLLLRGCKPVEEGPADLTLLYTGNVHGYIEPCGCAAGQIGGIDRIAGYVRDTLAELLPVVKDEATAFMQRLMHLCDASPHDPDRVMQIHFQLFPLTHAPQE